MLDIIPFELLELILFSSKPLDFQDLLHLRLTCKSFSLSIPSLYFTPIDIFPNFETLIDYANSKAIDTWFSRQLIQSHTIKPISFAPLLLLVQLPNNASLRFRVDSCVMSSSRNKEYKFGIGIKAVYERSSSLKEFDKEAERTEYICDGSTCSINHASPSSLNFRGCSSVSAIVDGDLGQVHDSTLPPHWRIFKQLNNEIRMIGMERGSHRLTLDASLATDEKLNRHRYICSETDQITRYISGITARYAELYSENK
jgi:hypothetical protein